MESHVLIGPKKGEERDNDSGDEAARNKPVCFRLNCIRIREDRLRPASRPVVAFDGHGILARFFVRIGIGHFDAAIAFRAGNDATYVL